MRLTHLLVAFAATGLAVTAASGTAFADPVKKPKPVTPAVITSTLTVPTVAIGEFAHITVYGVNYTDAVTVDWGDGTISSGEVSRCSERNVSRRPMSCSVQYWHPYAAPGAYPVAVNANGAPVGTHAVTVGRGHTPSTPPVDISDSGWRQQMVDSVNAVRAANGAAPVALCAALSQSSQKHSADMAARNFFDHTNPDGVSAMTRIGDEYGGNSRGENIAAGYPDVASVMAGWVASPGHFANLINPRYTHVGFGLASGGSYGTYWTQNFGAGGTC